MWQLLNHLTQQIAMDYMNALRHMGGSLVYELSLHPKPNIEEIIYSEEFIQTRGAQQRPDCLVHKARITEADALLVRDNHGPTGQPSLASCKQGAPYCRQFWICSACQMHDSFTSETTIWGVWLFKSKGSTVGGKQRGRSS